MKRNILDEKNIKYLLFKLSLPAMTGMMVMALYNIVDTIFVGRGVGTLGIAGLSIAFPVQMAVLALGQMFGIGSASIISRSLGRKDYEKANEVVSTIFSFGFIVSVLITIFGLVYIDKLLLLFGANVEVFPYAKSYMNVILLGTLFIIFSMTGNNIVRSEGKAMVAMFTLIIGAGLNIILDPIFIFYFDMGVAGAAWATVISQAFAATYLFIFLQSGGSTVHFNIRKMGLNIKLIIEILSIGLSSFARHIAGSLLFIVINNQLKIHGGAIGLAVFGIIFRSLKFIILPVMGIGQGLQPIVGYNYGAKRIDKVLEATKIALISSILVFLFGTVLVEAFPVLFLKIFSSDPEVLVVGKTALRIMLMLLPIVALQVIGAIMYQALGKAFLALILSMTREIFVLLPLLIILPNYIGMKGVWISYPISDFIGFVITLFLFIRLIIRLKKMMRFELSEV